MLVTVHHVPENILAKLPVAEDAVHVVGILYSVWYSHDLMLEIFIFEQL